MMTGAGPSRLTDARIFFQKGVHLFDAPFDPGDCGFLSVFGDFGFGRRLAGLQHFKLSLQHRADLNPVFDQIIDGYHHIVPPLVVNRLSFCRFRQHMFEDTEGKA